MHRIRHWLGGREQTTGFGTRAHNKQEIVSKEPSGIVLRQFSLKEPLRH